jgi:hypothetical protein
VDIDGYIEDLLQELKDIDAKVEESKLTSSDKIARGFVDWMACVLVAVALLAVSAVIAVLVLS